MANKSTKKQSFIEDKCSSHSEEVSAMHGLHENSTECKKVKKSDCCNMKSKKSRWWLCGIPSDDSGNILLLMFLYTLQGIPLGLTASVPLMLMSRHASYSQQGSFSFASWPFSLKLLWAPFVDSIYSTRMGRRKSWLIPVQYILGLSMFVISFKVSDWLGDDKILPNSSLSTNGTFNFSPNSANSTALFSGDSINLLPLTISFFWLNFLAATQDVAVDGWAISMLKRKNLGWASSCNTIGQTLGFCISYMLFLSLESKEFCNKWLRKEPKPYGIIQFNDFLMAWAIIVFISNTLVLFFKKEKKIISEDSEMDSSGHLRTPSPTTQLSEFSSAMNDTQNDESVKDTAETVTNVVATKEACVIDLSERLSLTATYFMMWRIIKLRNIQKLLILILFVKTATSVADSLANLKLIERGISKETVATLGLFAMPIQLILPLMIKRCLTGPYPLTTLLFTLTPRLLYGIVFSVFLHFVSSFRQSNGDFPYYFFVIVGTLNATSQALSYIMFTCQMAFYARISDPAIGGTYMTLLNTVSNLAFIAPVTLILYLVDPFSKKTCISGLYQNSSCLGQKLYKVCTSNNGECVIDVEGFYILMGACTIIGVLTVACFVRLTRRLESVHVETWYVVPRKHVEISNFGSS